MSFLSHEETESYREELHKMSESQVKTEKEALEQLILDADNTRLNAGISLLKLKKAEEKLVVLEEER